MRLRTLEMAVILGPRRKAQVLDIHARPVVANVIDLNAVGNRPVLAFPRVTVRARTFAVHANHTVAVSPLGAGPYQAVAPPFGAGGERLFGACVYVTLHVVRVTILAPPEPVRSAPAPPLARTFAAVDFAYRLIHSLLLG